MVKCWKDMRKRGITGLEEKILLEHPGEVAFNEGDGELPSLSSLMSLVMLASNTGFIDESAFWTQYRKIALALDHTSSYYHHYPIPKTNGRGYRDIYVVDKPIKHYQDVVRHLILDPIDIRHTSGYAYAYRHGISIRENAVVHAGHLYMVKLDIKDFFDSIRQCDVFKVFDKYTDYNKAVKTVLTKLCCRDGHLSQGSSTSPQLANLVMAGFDDEVAAYCMPLGITYSRYCDDMTFSSDEKMDVEGLIGFVTLRLKEHHFRLNRRKTKVMGPDCQHIVTGVVANNPRVRAKPEYKKRLRQEIYYIKKFGISSHLRRIAPPDHTISFEGPGTQHEFHYLTRLLGQVGFALQIDPDDEELLEMEKYLKKAIPVCYDETQLMRARFIEVICEMVARNRISHIDPDMRVKTYVKRDGITITASFMLDSKGMQEFDEMWVACDQLRHNLKGHFIPGWHTSEDHEPIDWLYYEHFLADKDFAGYPDKVKEIADDIMVMHEMLRWLV